MGSSGERQFLYLEPRQDIRLVYKFRDSSEPEHDENRRWAASYVDSVCQAHMAGSIERSGRRFQFHLVKQQTKLISLYRISSTFTMSESLSMANKVLLALY